jgi:hypothetical protein
MTLLSPPRTHDHDEEVDRLVPSVEPDLKSQDADAPAAPAQHEIATEAYTRYLLRGCQDGHAVEDWLGAERSLREKYSLSS